MIQYNPNLNAAYVNARLTARADEAKADRAARYARKNRADQARRPDRKLSARLARA